MLRPSLRLSAALAALVTVAAPVVVTAPVHAEVDCTPTLAVTMANEAVIDDTWPAKLGFNGWVTDPCPTDGWFDDQTEIQAMHGDVALSDGTTDSTVAFCCFGQDPGSYFGSAAFYGERYKKVSVLGPATLTLWATDGTHGWISASASFFLRRAARFPAFHARAQRVGQESGVMVSGYLTRLVYYASGQARYIPYAGKRVDVYVGDYLPSVWRYADYTTTTSTGYFTKSVATTFDGHWNVGTADTNSYAGRLAWVRGIYVTTTP